MKKTVKLAGVLVTGLGMMVSPLGIKAADMNNSGNSITSSVQITTTAQNQSTQTTEKTIHITNDSNSNNETQDNSNSGKISVTVNQQVQTPEINDDVKVSNTDTETVINEEKAKQAIDQQQIRDNAVETIKEQEQNINTRFTEVEDRLRNLKDTVTGKSEEASSRLDDQITNIEKQREDVINRLESQITRLQTES